MQHITYTKQLMLPCYLVELHIFLLKNFGIHQYNYVRTHTCGMWLTWPRPKLRFSALIENKYSIACDYPGAWSQRITQFWQISRSVGDQVIVVIVW